MADVCITEAWVLVADGNLERADLRIRGGVIHELGSSVSTRHADVLELSGGLVTAGLVDAHTHLTLAGLEPLPAAPGDRSARSRANLRSLLESGVTAVRDVGGFDQLVVEVRDAVARGLVKGPEVHAANQILCAPGGHGSQLPGVGFEARGPQGFRQAVRQQVDRQADLIKIALNGAAGEVEISVEELAAAVDEAHVLGRRVACHASVPDAVEVAILAGVDTIEHANGASLEQLERMAEAGIVVVPTAWAFAQHLADSTDAEHTGDPLALALREILKVRVRGHHMIVRDAISAGTTIAAGTDALVGYSADAMSEELATLNQLGLSPTSALRAATYGSSIAIGRAGPGVVAEGARADLAVFDQGPEAVVVGKHKPRAVFLRGERIARHP